MDPNNPDDLAIVVMDEHPLDALSRLPQGNDAKGNSNWVIRVSRRRAQSVAPIHQAPQNERDQFDVIGFLYVEDNELKIAKAENITFANKANYHFVWNLFTETSGGGSINHAIIGMYNPDSKSYLKATGAVNDPLTASESADNTDYFTLKPYVDHVIEEVIVDEHYQVQGDEVKNSKIIDGHTIYYVERHEDHIDQTRHFIHLQNGTLKIHCDETSTGVYSMSIKDAGESSHETTQQGDYPWYNNYDADGKKDDYIFELLSVEVAEPTHVVYQFHATDTNSGAKWVFEINSHNNAEKAITLDEFNDPNHVKFVDTFKGLNGEDIDMLRYYKNFSNGPHAGDGTFLAPGDDITSTYPRVCVSCEANFPFTISNDISFDNAHGDVSFLTLSVGADNRNQDGHYVAYEGETEATATMHGHDATDCSKFKTDFRRHIFTGLFWTITKSEAEVSNPNSIRLHTFGEGLYMMQADVHAGDEDLVGKAEHKLYPFVSENIKDLANDNCDHEVFVIIPNGDGFSLVLKTDPTNKIVQTSGNDFGIGTKPTDIKDCKMYANDAYDLINVLVNPRYTRNIGGMNFADPWDKESYTALTEFYRNAFLWRKGAGKDVVLQPEVWGGDDAELEYRMRLQALHYSMLEATNYHTIEPKKQYRIELFDENSETVDKDNKMLSSFESYVKLGAAEIPTGGAGMQKAEFITSALVNGSAKSASSYWQIFPTETDITPETGEEIQVAFYNSNVKAFLKKIIVIDNTDPLKPQRKPVGVTFDNVVENPYSDDFDVSALGDDYKFYIKQEGTSDQWVILSDMSTETGVHKLAVVRGDGTETYGFEKTDSPDAFDVTSGIPTIKPTNTLYWSRNYDHGQAIQTFSYNTEHIAHHGRWMLTKIESYPLTISDVGWASLCLPYSVKYKNSDVTAYYAGEAGELTDEDKEHEHVDNYSAKMELHSLDIDAGDDYKAIPANTPVLFQRTHGSGKITVDLIQDNSIDDNESIKTTMTTITAANKFKAVNAQWGHSSLAPGDGGITNRQYYGLGNKAYGVAFYPIEYSPNPYLVANKAFLISDDVKVADPSSQVKPMALILSVEEDQTITEINTVTGEVTTRPADGIYYDLSGRRVLTPKKGIYINSKGQKLFVK